MGRGRPRGSGTKIQWKKRTAFIDLYVPADLRPHFGGRTSVRRYLGAVELQEAYRLAAEARLEHESHIRSLEDPAHDQHRLTALTADLVAEAVDTGLTLAEMLSRAPVADHAGILTALTAISPSPEVTSVPVLRVGSRSPSWSPEALKTVTAGAQRKLERGMLTATYTSWMNAKARKAQTRREAENALTEFRTTVKVSTVEEVTRSHLMQYRDWLKAKGDLSPVTINQRLTWIRTILQQGWDDLGITGFSVRNLKLATPKGTRRQRQWPPEDIITALRALKNQPVDYAWAFLLALTTGCRPAEIAHLRVDWWESVGVFNLPGWAAKNGNQRYLPIIPILHDPLEAFIEQRPEGAYLLDVARVAALRDLNEAEQHQMAMGLPPEEGEDEHATKDKMGHALTQWQSRFNKKNGITGVTYDLRHNWQRHADAVGLPTRIQYRISGHSSDSVGDRYGETEQMVLVNANAEVNSRIITPEVETALTELLTAMVENPKRRRQLRSRVSRHVKKVRLVRR